MEVAEQKILHAAKIVFQKRGFHGARMQEIADKAGINKASLHYYYRSKSKLFQRVFETVFNTLFPKITSILSSQDNIWDKIDLLVENYIDYFSENAHLLQFVLTELHTNSEIIEKILEKHTTELPIFSFMSELQTEMEKNNIREVNPLHFILDIVSLSAFPFLAKNLIMNIAPLSNSQIEDILSQRKAHVKQFIRTALLVNK